MERAKNKQRPDEYLILSPTEDRVLQYLIKQKTGARVSIIARDLNIARTSIYLALHKLIKKKLVVKDGFLYSIADKKLKLYEQTEHIPKKQVEKLLTEMLQLKKGEIIYSIESDAEITALLKLKKELFAWQKDVVKKGIVLKGIGTKKALELFQGMISGGLEKEIKKRSGAARFTNDTIKGPCALVSFKNTVVFFSRSKNFFYRIDNPDVAHFVQSIIDSLYSQYEYEKIV